MANPTTIYGLPAPLLSGQADGPDAFQDLNDKLETTLGNMTRSFTATIPDITVGAGYSTVYTTPPISAVPLGRAVLLFVYMNCRIASASAQFGVAQLQEGGTVLTNSTAVQVSTVAYNTIVAPIMLVACRTFAVAPVLVVSAGGSPDGVNMTEIRVAGLGFGWPS